eukprot:scaffold16110_cov148-Isochrysis_galbana.AAC.10
MAGSAAHSNEAVVREQRCNATRRWSAGSAANATRRWFAGSAAAHRNTRRWLRRATRLRGQQLTQQPNATRRCGNAKVTDGARRGRASRCFRKRRPSG